jgi:hypothetical protein
MDAVTHSNMMLFGHGRLDNYHRSKNNEIGRASGGEGFRHSMNLMIAGVMLRTMIRFIANRLS